MILTAVVYRNECVTREQTSRCPCLQQQAVAPRSASYLAGTLQPRWEPQLTNAHVWMRGVGTSRWTATRTHTRTQRSHATPRSLSVLRAPVGKWWWRFSWCVRACACRCLLRGGKLTRKVGNGSAGQSPVVAYSGGGHTPINLSRVSSRDTSTHPHATRRGGCDLQRS
jgi:hypothetical protein